MVDLAKRRSEVSGLGNVSFQLGDISDIPFPVASFDVIVSNCVINLCADKQRVWQEIARCLKATGRAVIADTVLTHDLPLEVKQSELAFSCCVSGAAQRSDYLEMIRYAGFSDVHVVSEYNISDEYLEPLYESSGIPASDIAPVRSLTIQARLRQKSVHGRDPLVLMLGGIPSGFDAAASIKRQVILLGPKKPGDRPLGNLRFYQHDIRSAQDVIARLRSDIGVDISCIEAVVSLEEYFLPLCSAISLELGLTPAMPKDTAEIGLHKVRMREVFAIARVPGPKYGVARTADEAESIAARLGLKVVVKPDNDSNSRFVALCETGNDVRSAAQDILDAKFNLVGQPLSRVVLVEEYVPGDEFSLDVVMLAGDIVFAAACRKKFGPPPYFIEIGHVYPAGLASDEYSALLKASAASLRAAGVRSGAAHIEARIKDGRCRIIEINLRPPGGRMAEMILNATGVDLRRVHLQVLAGSEVDCLEQIRALGAVYHCITVPAPSRLHYDGADIQLTGTDVLPIIELDVRSGDAVFPVAHPLGRIAGRIVAYGSTVRNAEYIAEQIQEQLKLRLEPLSQREISDLVEADRVRGTLSRSGCWGQGCC
jgi:SAM-dependent methyltransferase